MSEPVNYVINGYPYGTLPESEVTPPPAPWQERTLGTGTGQADYNAGEADKGEAFTLSVTPDEGEVSHFVYQSVDTDATLTARVNLPVTTDPNAKAGLMLRSEQADSAYAFLGLGADGVVFEYTDEAGNLQRVKGGDSNETAMYLRLERKEGSVYAYESVDGVRWTKVTALSFALTTPFNFGITAAAQSHDVRAAISEVQVEMSPQGKTILFSESKRLPRDKVSGDFTGSVLIKNPDYLEEECPHSGAACDYAVGVFKDVLKSDATLNVSVVESPETSLKGLTPIGNKLVMELPLNSVNLDTARPIIALISPSFPGAYEDAIGNAFAEISITLGDGREYVTLRDYKLGNAIFVQRADIRLALERFDLPRPETLRISVLPTRRQTPDTPPEDNGDESNTQQDGDLGSLRTLSVASPFEDRYATGLFKLTDTYNYSMLCEGDSEIAPDNGLSISEGKTPLILVHGWTLLDNYRSDILTEIDDRTNETVFDRPEEGVFSKDYYSPAHCYWRAFIENFYADSLSIPIDILREEYELFTFGWNSHVAIEDVANSSSIKSLAVEIDRLRQANPTTFKDAVILNHSTGGLVTKAYMQTHPTTHRVKHVISTGAPYRGSPIPVCTAASETVCTASTVNESFRANLVENLDGWAQNPPMRRGLGNGQGILNFFALAGSTQTTRDLTWEFGGEFQGFDSFDAELEITYTIRTVTNPLLNRLNVTEASNFKTLADKFTVYHATSSGPNEVDRPLVANNPQRNVQVRMARAIEGGTFHRSEELTPIQSACIGSNINSCEGSPFEGNLIYRPAQVHTDLINTPNMASLTTELLRITERLNDIDDGTPDGTQRLYIGNSDSEKDCEEVDNVYHETGVCTDALNESRPLTYADFDFGGANPQPEGDRWRRFGEDADANNLLGDGQIGTDSYQPRLDMSDLRRFRDELIYLSWTTDGTGSDPLNGSLTHPKKDMGDLFGHVSDRDRTLFTPTYPFWSDFNGDGWVSLDDRLPVAGLAGANVSNRDVNGTPNLTDLEVLYYTAKTKPNWWQDEHYKVSELSLGEFTGLLDSGDLEVWPHQFLRQDDISLVTSCVRLATAEKGDCFETKREHTLDSNDHDKDYYRQVYTLPLNNAGYIVEVRGVDARGRVLLYAERKVELSLGSDDFWDPTPLRFDVDDDTPHGNQYSYITQNDGAGADSADGVASSLETGKALMYSDFSDAGATDFTNTDAAEDGHVGDGEFVAVGDDTVYAPNVDRADFRRFRDALLASEPNLNTASNGSDSNPKKQTGEGSAALELLDYNGDGKLDLNATAPVQAMQDVVTNGALHYTFTPEGSGLRTRLDNRIETDEDGLPLMSDFDVFYHGLEHDLRTGSLSVAGEPLWQEDPELFYTLPNLMSSGDIEVWPHLLLNTPDFPVTSVTTSVEGVEGASVTHELSEGNQLVMAAASGTGANKLAGENERYVYTLPVRDEPYKVTAIASGADGELFRSEALIEVALGGSVLWDPVPLVADLDDGTKDGNQTKLITSETASGDAVAHTV